MVIGDELQCVGNTVMIALPDFRHRGTCRSNGAFAARAIGAPLAM
jgi:hypothetical protein